MNDNKTCRYCKQEIKEKQFIEIALVYNNKDIYRDFFHVECFNEHLDLGGRYTKV